MPKIDRNEKCSSKHLAMCSSSSMLLSKLSLLLLLLPPFAIHLCLLSIFITIKKQENLKLDTKFEPRCVAKTGSYINICKPSGPSFRRWILALLTFVVVIVVVVAVAVVLFIHRNSASSLTGNKASQKSL